MRVDGVNTATLKEHKHRYVAVVKRTCIDAVNVVAMMFSTATYSSAAICSKQTDS